MEAAGRAAPVNTNPMRDVENSVFAASPWAKVEPLPKELEKEPGLDDPSQRAMLAARELQKAVGSCREARTLFEGMAGQDPSTRMTTFKTRVVDAVDACKC